MDASDPDLFSPEVNKARILARLTPTESVWMSRQPWLQHHGYLLRPRYNRLWVPSWKAAGEYVIAPGTEDAVLLPEHANIIDATRIKDGQLVCLKWLQKSSIEARVRDFLSRAIQPHDAQDHCVPFLDTFRDIDNDSASYAVMPFLRQFDDPAFQLIDDVVDFVNQTLDGLVYMHQHHVAHRECTSANIMMDATPLFPQGFHPVNTRWLPDLSALAMPQLRFAASVPVKYYFVSFENAIVVQPGEESRLVNGACYAQQEIPELVSADGTPGPYDPFRVDVFLLGTVYGEICERWSNTGFLRPLVSAMTCSDPKQRPDAASALRLWQQSWFMSTLLDVVVFVEILPVLARRLVKELSSAIYQLICS